MGFRERFLFLFARNLKCDNKTSITRKITIEYDIFNEIKTMTKKI